MPSTVFCSPSQGAAKRVLDKARRERKEERGAILLNCSDWFRVG
jgi:hypothetical protein